MFFSSSVNCEELQLHNQRENEEFYQTGVCVARCLTNSAKNLNGCFQKCDENRTNTVGIVEILDEKFELKLLCRDNSSLTIKIYDKTQKEEPSADRHLLEKRSLYNGREIPKRLQRKIVYLVKVQQSDEQIGTRLIYLSNSTILKISNLKPNKLYNITASALTSDAKVYPIKIVNETVFRTLFPGYKPKNVTNIYVEKFTNGLANPHLIDALITWEPASDMTCHYEIVFHSQNTKQPVQAFDIKDSEKLFKFRLNSLEFNDEYSVAIRGRHTKDPRKESSLVWRVFYTPTCIEWHRRIDICPPEEPQNVTVFEKYVNNFEYNLNFTWSWPQLSPNYYSLYIYDLVDSPDVIINPETKPGSYAFNISGSAVDIYLPQLKLLGHGYEWYLTAYSPGGNNTVHAYRSLQQINLEETTNDAELYFFIVILTLTTIVTFMVGIFLYHRKEKLKRDEERCEYFAIPTGAISELLAPINDELEVKREKVVISDCVLGEGAFGLVRRATLYVNDESSIDVAVKMLKDCPQIEEIKEFRREIDMMKSVGRHPNIVGIMGHCTQNISDMLLLTEFCSEGSLLDYLRIEWKKCLKIRKFSVVPANEPNLNSSADENEECQTPALSNQKCPESVFNFDTSFVNDKKSLTYKEISDSNYPGAMPANIIVNRLYDHPPTQRNTCTNACKCDVKIYDNQDNKKIKISECGCQNFVANRGYGSEELLQDQQKIVLNLIKSEELLKFAQQIAIGMAFLAQNKVVHRDLAARNVLVCPNKVVKIADFGLSRDIYQDNMYRKTTKGKLPIKWLALESMTHQVYTSQSDVWSFGILFYEIVTLGGNPYPSVPVNRLLKLLKTGYRMERPLNCDEEVYQVMYSCWLTHPNDRPTFEDLIEQIDCLLKKETNDHKMINLQLGKPKKVDSGYLEPVSY